MGKVIVLLAVALGTQVDAQDELSNFLRERMSKIGNTAPTDLDGVTLGKAGGAASASSAATRSAPTQRVAKYTPNMANYGDAAFSQIVGKTGKTREQLIKEGVFGGYTRKMPAANKAIYQSPRRGRTDANFNTGAAPKASTPNMANFGSSVFSQVVGSTGKTRDQLIKEGVFGGYNKRMPSADKKMYGDSIAQANNRRWWGGDGGIAQPKEVKSQPTKTKGGIFR